MTKIITINDADFAANVKNNDLPVLVDFWAEWCGPCKAITPTLEELASELEGKIVIAKINVDDNEKLPVQFGIRSIPTLILFNKGENIATHIGGGSKTDLMNFIQSNLPS